MFLDSPAGLTGQLGVGAPGRTGRGPQQCQEDAQASANVCRHEAILSASAETMDLGYNELSAQQVANSKTRCLGGLSRSGKLSKALPKG